MSAKHNDLYPQETQKDAHHLENTPALELLAQR